MESLLSLLRMHWDHEPTPNPSQEGNCRRVDDCLLPSWEGSGVGRFMESLLGLIITHWDHEPRPGGRWRASVLDCGSPLPLLRPCTRFESARGLAHSKTWRRGVRFKERTVRDLCLHCILEPALQASIWVGGPAARASRNQRINGSTSHCFSVPTFRRLRTTDGARWLWRISSADNDR